MKGKKILILLVLLALVSSPMVSCSKEKEITFDITKEDVENKSGDVEIKSVELDLGEGATFIPVYFEGSDVYGLQYSWGGGKSYEYPIEGGFKENLYKLSEDGKLIDTNKKPVKYWSGNRYIHNGIFDSEEDKGLYFVDQKEGIEKRIGDGIFGLSIEVERRTNKQSEAKLVDGNEDYAFIQDIEHINNDKDGYKVAFLGLKLINIKENRTYVYKGNSKVLFDKVVYSKSTNSFYAVDVVGGNIYEVILNEGEIKLEKYDEVETNTLSKDFYGVEVIESGEFVIWLSNNTENLLLTYDPKSKIVRKTKRGNSVYEIDAYYGNVNKFILYKEDSESNNVDKYIGELNSEGQIEVLAKFDGYKKENTISSISNRMVSEDGENMIIIERTFDKSDDLLKKNTAHFIKFK